MNQPTLYLKLFIVLVSIYPTVISAQDTLLLHYANATISEVILDDSTNGAITGKGEDGSLGKYMFFDSGLHRSPVAELVSVLMDLEVSDFSTIDSFSVFIQQFNGEDWEDTWEKRFAFSEIEEESSVIASNGIASYNFKIDILESEIADIGSLSFNVGIKYSNDTNAKIALRSTGIGEFPEAETRCFTINEDESISDFVTSYGAEVGLAIFPVTLISGSIEEFSELGLELLNDGDNLIVINSSNLGGQFNLSLFSLDGYLIKQEVLSSRGSVKINTIDLPAGIYILNASNGKRIGNMKVYVD